MIGVGRSGKIGCLSAPLDLRPVGLAVVVGMARCEPGPDY